MFDIRTNFQVFQEWFFTGIHYCTKVLVPHIYLLRGGVGPDFILMEDNTTPHRLVTVSEFLESEDIQRMVWPGMPTELNPIGHVWYLLGRCV